MTANAYLKKIKAYLKKYVEIDMDDLVMKIGKELGDWQDKVGHAPPDYVLLHVTDSELGKLKDGIQDKMNAIENAEAAK